MNIAHSSATEIALAVREGEIAARQVVEEFLARISRHDQAIGAFLRVDSQAALAQAQAVDEKRKKGLPLGPLAGVPVAIKDNILMRGELATCASKMLAHFKAPYDATVIGKLKAADAICLGRTNMDEFAMGSSTENSAFQKTKNPWDIQRIPGGSSGGSAAAVAARFVPLAIGSDTGGSIRQPAALCGIAGLKPTYGRVSRFGLIAFASSLDQIGPLAHNVKDLALCQSVLEGHDPKDSTSVNTTASDYDLGDANLSGLRLGIPKEYFVSGLDTGVQSAVEEALKVFQKQGARLVEISLPHTAYAIAVYYIIATAEASSNLARYDGVKYGLRAGVKGNAPEDVMDLYLGSRSAGFGPEGKRRILLGTYVLSAGYYDAYYLKALKVRTLLRKDFQEAFAQCDAILTPTSPCTAFKIGERAEDPLRMYLSDIFTISVNLAGIPGLSIPCGFAGDAGNALPVGLQILGKPFAESTIMKIAAAYQAATDFHQRVPPTPALPREGGGGNAGMRT